MPREPMRRAAELGGSAVFISAKHVNALVEGRGPGIDLCKSVAMAVPGIVAHQSAYEDGQQLPARSSDRAESLTLPVF